MARGCNLFREIARHPLVVIDKQQISHTRRVFAAIHFAKRGSRPPSVGDRFGSRYSAKSPAPVGPRSPLPVPMMSEEFVMVIARRRRRPRGGHAKCRIPTEHDCSLGDIFPRGFHRSLPRRRERTLVFRVLSRASSSPSSLSRLC